MTRLCQSAVGLALSLALGACSFEAAEEDASPLDMNACAIDEDCRGGARCAEGMCVADDAAEPLAVMLEISPQRMPDGSDSLPIVLPRFRVEGALERTWELPLPVIVGVRIEHSGEPVQAELRFVPVGRIPQVPRKAVTASTADAVRSTADDVHYSVHLLSGVEYRVLVRPLDPSLPPVERAFTAREGVRVDLDYGDLSMRQQTFAFSGAPPERSLRVRALHGETGELISSVATLEGGRATLLFSPGAAPYRLEITAEQALDGSSQGVVDSARVAQSCDSDTPIFPVLSIDHEAIDSGQVGIRELALPPAPMRIRYEGTVELCSDAMMSASEVDRLPISLRSTSLLLSELAEPTAFEGSFSATTDAELDPDSGQLRFCIDVMPGQYDVVVTPPAGMVCAIFAESRLIEAPDDVAVTGALLELPAPAYLSGGLRTSEGEPMAGAIVDAVALGRSSGLELAEDDATLTAYNRSHQTATDEQGAFHLPVDLGSYDVTVKPVSGSGFAWTVFHDVDIGSRDVDFANLIDVSFPLPIEGQLRYTDGLERDQATLEEADVRAFAVLEDERGAERAVGVGRAVADADGSFTLLLSPALQDGW